MKRIILAGLLSMAAATAEAENEVVPVALIKKIVVDNQDRVEATDTEVRVIRARSGSLVPARRALALFEDDQVITGANVSLILLFQKQAADEEKEAMVAAASQIRVRSNASLFLILGRILLNVRGFFEVGRPEGLLGAGGTEFEVRGEADGSTSLTVLEGTVEVSSAAGGSAAGAPTPGTDDRPALGIRVAVDAGQTGSALLSITVRNGCAQDHIYEIRSPDSFAWVSVVGERFSVAPGSKRVQELSLKLDATRVTAGEYRGDVVLKCLDCAQESGCAVAGQSIPLQVTVKGGGTPSDGSEVPSPAAPRLRVARLQELTLPRGRPPETPHAANEDDVRSALDWSNDAVLAGRPAFSQRGAAPYFESPKERDRLFREARFRAVWSQSGEDYERLGDSYCDFGEGAKGLEAYQRAGRASPARQASPAFVARVAEAHRLKGRLKEADETVQQALALDPRQPLALMSLGNLRLDQAGVARDAGDNGRARELLGGAVQAFTDASRTEAGRDLAAIAGANRGEANLALGNLARQEGKAAEAQERFQDAEKAFQAVQSARPDYPYSDTGLADVYRGYFGVAVSRGDKDRAQNHFQQSEQRYSAALKQNRGPFAAWTGLGTLYREVNRDDRAIEAFTRAVELQPAKPLAHWRLGAALAKTDPVRAAQYMRTYLDLEAPALKQGQRAAEAEAIVKKAAQGESPAASATRVPAVEGLSVADAERTLRAAGFQPGGVERQPSRQPAGTVLGQRPAAGEPAPARARVDLVIAAPGPGPGPGPALGEVKVPKVEGDKEQDAVRELQKRNLLPRVVPQASCETAGRVLTQNPKKDTKVPEGSPVTITVASVGGSPVRVPPLQKMPQRRAEEVLRRSGLTSRARTMETSAAEPGTVLDQQPAANELVAPGCPVQLTVAEPERLVKVPDFRGMSEKDALSQLGFMGSLLSGLARGTINGGGSGGSVVRQDPSPGSDVPRGTRVNLWIGPGRTTQPTPDLVRVPGVLNYALQPAVDIIKRAGLVANVVGRGGCVVRQSPVEKTAVARGSPVAIYMGQCPIG